MCVTQCSVENLEIFSHVKKTSNQLFRNLLFSKTVAFTKFLPKMRLRNIFSRNHRHFCNIRFDEISVTFFIFFFLIEFLVKSFCWIVDTFKLIKSEFNVKNSDSLVQKLISRIFFKNHSVMWFNNFNAFINTWWVNKMKLNSICN